MKSYYLNRIPLKCCMDYMQLHELALQRFHFVDCGQLVTMNINFRVICTGFLKLLAISSLWIFCSISLHHNLVTMYFACFPKTAEDSFFRRQSWPQWLFQWIYLVIIAFFVSTDHQMHAMSTHPLYLFPVDPCQVNLFLSPSSYLYHHGNWSK